MSKLIRIDDTLYNKLMELKQDNNFTVYINSLLSSKQEVNSLQAVNKEVNCSSKQDSKLDVTQEVFDDINIKSLQDLFDFCIRLNSVQNNFRTELNTLKMHFEDSLKEIEQIKEILKKAKLS